MIGLCTSAIHPELMLTSDEMHQLENLHGLSHQWGTNYSYIWDSTKFQQGTPYNLRGVNEYEQKTNKCASPQPLELLSCLNSYDHNTHSPKTLGSEHGQYDAMRNKLKLNFWHLQTDLTTSDSLDLYLYPH